MINSVRQIEGPHVGHLLTSEGLRVDTGNVQAIPEKPGPPDVKRVQRLLCVVTHLSKSYHYLSADCEGLRQLTQKENTRVE